MHTGKRLNAVFESSPELIFDDRSKFIFFSDCHRGDNSWADDFAHNEHIYYYALTRYYRMGYTYVEIGDGDELWENDRFEDIRIAHSTVFKLLRRFYNEGRFVLLYGNHDKERKSQARVKNTLHRYFDERSGTQVPFLEGITVHEGIVLRHASTGMRIFLVHGHQGDLLGDQLWWLGKLLSRLVWRQLQLMGIHDPTRPAVNYTKRKRVERRLMRWVRLRRQMVVTGHTHRPRFPEPGAPPFFNDGSCVHPRSITGLEIVNGKISLVRWHLSTRDDGTLRIGRDVLAGPTGLSEYA
jgi:predicted phosphodiesterase